MSSEAVLTIHRYYDGPELGVAEFNGRPHVYERIVQSHDGKPEIYRLSPIEPDALSAVMEDWQLFLRWNAAQDERSRSDINDDPRVLAEDLPRHFQLQPIVGAALKIDEADAVTAAGTFVFESPFQGWVDWTLAQGS